MNKTEGRADGMTQEQSSVEGRAELKAKADSLFYIKSFSLAFFCMKAPFSFGTQ